MLLTLAGYRDAEVATHFLPCAGDMIDDVSSDLRCR